MSTTISVTLNESQKAWLEDQVRNGNYLDAEAVVQELLDEARSRQRVDGHGIITPEEQGRQRKHFWQQAEKMVEEALRNGPATPLTPQDWAGLRQRLEARLAAKGQVT